MSDNIVSDMINIMLTDIFCNINYRLKASILAKKEILDSQRPFPSDVVAKIRDQLNLEWTFNSNAIEGNTLTLQETEIVLKRGITIGNKNLREHFEAINHDQAIKFLEDFVAKKETLSLDTIKTIHKIVMKNIEEYGSGSFRHTNVKIIGAVHIPPESYKIQSEMENLLNWYFENQNVLSVPELAAWFHYHFVWIHPFVDGNGRTARLLMNLILIQNGYPPAIILNVDRKKYYRVLRKADMDKPQEFIDFIGKYIERSLVIYIEALKNTDSEKTEEGYITLAKAAENSRYSQEYLSLLARRGILPAVKFENKWMTTREAVEEYERGES